MGITLETTANLWQLLSMAISTLILIVILDVNFYRPRRQERKAVKRALKKLETQKKIYQDLLGSGINNADLLTDIRYDAETYSILETNFTFPAHQLFSHASQSRKTASLDKRIAALDEICCDWQTFWKST